ncbi:MAG: sigma-70 family RNA polymerase sigma factor [candidate division KSB1 bacterium]|nr:sigma-70 family RNA polymerase sigma factor [candidate division KSB1 bacterium]MDZ7367544.1 sigma-70 family RNA polymerase sigma factor [candidate division KSB1 bacterium]MDZ7404898.1 sigma-70 family RNA polymerase sigma factor [candidate division KSB1 bacterium]
MINSFVGEINASAPTKEWIASRREAVKNYLWKRWDLRGEDLEDVLQETMTAALQSFSNYKGLNDAEPGTYLIGIAKNVAHSHIRRRNRHERPLTSIEEIAGSLGVVFRDEVEAEEMAKLLREKISKLPKNYIQVLELVFYKDYREREVAAKLGIPAEKVYSLKSDALKRLRKLCKKDSRFRP